MANNLRKFETEADYSAATLVYPSVAWIVGSDSIHFDKEGSTPTVNRTLKIAFTTDESYGKSFYVQSDNTIIDSLTVNGTPITITGSTMEFESEANTDYLIEWELKPSITDLSNNFVFDTPWGSASSDMLYDMLIPAQVTRIGSLKENELANIIFEGTTPPTFSPYESTFPYNGRMYAPESAISAYMEAWSEVTSVYPISEYNGKIPV